MRLWALGLVEEIVCVVDRYGGCVCVSYPLRSFSFMLTLSQPCSPSGLFITTNKNSISPGLRQS